MKYWHKTNGRLYGPVNSDLETYKDRIRNAYGSLRGVKIIEAENHKDATTLAFYPHDEPGTARFVK